MAKILVELERHEAILVLAALENEQIRHEAILVLAALENEQIRAVQIMNTEITGSPVFKALGDENAKVDAIRARIKKAML